MKYDVILKELKMKLINFLVQFS